MRKNLLALSIAAMVGGLSGVANATTGLNSAGTLDLISFGPESHSADTLVGSVAAGYPVATQLTPAPSGIGHILVVPYFTSQATNHSLLNIVNTDLVNGKAVKLRYRGAANSDDLFDITIYLSPGDMWTADVAVDAEGFSRLETADNSCTLPSAADIKAANNGRFVTNRVRNADKEQTREGYIEILNTADIVPDTALFKAIKHVAGKAPCDQAVMDAQSIALTGWALDSAGNPITDLKDKLNANVPANRGYSWPTGGLLANWAIVDFASTASFSGEAVALRATSSNIIDEQGSGRLVWAPQTNEVVTLANAKDLTADPLLRNGAIKTASYDFPDLSTPYFTRLDASGKFIVTPGVQANALARDLAVRNVTNEFLTNSSIQFQTDWVFSMPTRRYAVGVNYGATNTLVFNNGADGGTAVEAHFTSANVMLDAQGRACVDAGSMRAFDREETSRNSFVISPNATFRFCGEASVLAFNKKDDQPTVLGAKIARTNIDTKMLEGWFTIATPGLGNGLPVVGFAAAKAAGNFGGTWNHRFERNLR